MIDAGLAHVVASDAHSIAKRPPALAEARRRVSSRWGDETARMLFERNTAACTQLEQIGVP
jgi:tyrosine-protein phosphatase YwqE